MLAVAPRADEPSRSRRSSVPWRSCTWSALGATASIALYTILRELIDQAVRRGPPRTLAIDIVETDDGGILAAVADDAEPERRRRSLESIEERVRQLHGTLEIGAPEDGGTRIAVTLPAHTARR